MSVELSPHNNDAERGEHMLYHILCKDKSGHLQTRLDNREAHLALVNTLGDRLFAAGPLLDEQDEMVGSVLIIDFDSDEAAAAFCAADPYAQAGLFEEVTISRWRKTLPN